jgi:hypothetical protein
MAINSITGNTLLTTGAFPPARVASAGSPLNPPTGGLLIVDGVQLVAGDRVLCKDEANPVNNGIYAANTGPWVRTTDATANTQFFSGMLVSVGVGAVNKGAIFFCTCTDDPIVVGTSPITFSPVLGGSSVLTGPARTVFGVAGNSSGPFGNVTATSGSGGILAESGGTLAFRTSLPGGYTIGANLTIDTGGNLIAPTVNKLTLTQPASAATLTIANTKTLTALNSISLAGVDGKTATFNNSLSFAGADGKSLTLNTSLTVSTNDGTLSFGSAAKTLTVNNSGTLAGGDAFTLVIAANKTFAVNNSLAFSGTDSTTFSFPNASDTVVTLAATQTLTNKTIDSASNTLKVSGVTVSAGQYPGSTTNDSATAGNVGEYVSSSVASGSAISLTTNVVANLTSISLTPGDWDVWGIAQYLGTGSTTVNSVQTTLSLVSATQDTTNGRYTYTPAFGTTGFANPLTAHIGPARFSLSTTTTIYLTVVGTFAASTLSAYGILQARRRR